MNRLPRRAVSVQPPRRGRAAGRAQPLMTIVRQRPARTGQPMRAVEPPEPLPPDWVAAYRQWPRLFALRPVQWLAVLVALVGLSFLAGRLL
ncbi:MAG: hypothetical protein F6J97_09305 [Leptolyngbya sp. SIO4C1]|nr:hypothetical protein [Leptolyngbya sp. SIO4C1]